MPVLGKHSNFLHIYLQLICEGTPYQNPKNKIGTEEIGLDVGVGTIATVSDTHRKSLHGKDINEIIAMGTRIQTEKVSYKGWQKRYGRSINMRAPILSDAISRAKQTAIGKVCPASFGFTRIQSQSGSLVNPIRIISEAMDAVILPDESHRELV